ncbi:serine/threonine-protein kinase [Nocardia sp. CA-128927]|uniref:serine/threonine-protein kinase n=1 Tax=Nocardia sp. CA-128927 TaxID=3239975 RepID=UPI003D97E912
MAESLLPGTVFAGYLIERKLGSGGMGAVYLARHPRLPRRDALKVLSQAHSADAEFRARFLREAELAARLDHPNIVAVQDRGVEYGRPWIAMQFVDGVDAAELIRRGAAELPPTRVLHIITEAAHGLDEAHRAGMLHRDVKPANILLERRPAGPERVLVADFGIGRAAAETTKLTETGTVLATLAYAAPEQLAGQVVDHRADIYALGCTLYELLTGSKPFPRANPLAVMQAHLQDPPPRPTMMNPALPQAIDAVVAQAMAKRPEDRYGSCGALADAALAAFGVTEQPTLDVRAPAGKARRRRTGFVIVAALALALAAAASAVALTRNSGDTPVAPSTSTPVGGPTVVPPRSPVAAPPSWGSHNYMVRALPELLPKTPADSGYQGIRCVAIGKDKLPIDVNQQAGETTTLSCNGDRNPVALLQVECNVNRTLSKIGPYHDLAPGGDERWERPTGSGRVIWQDTRDPAGQPAGAVQIGFDGGERGYCQLRVFGGTSGRDLVDRWWRDAPL